MLLVGLSCFDELMKSVVILPSYFANLSTKNCVNLSAINNNYSLAMYIVYG